MKTDLERRTYSIWKGMRSRCNNQHSKAFPSYGGRGIRVCDRWNSFAAFLADMGIAPVDGCIDRIDNNGNYEPGNCRWVNHSINNNNRRNTRLIEFGGERLSIAQWGRRFGKSRWLIADRLKWGWSIEKALTTPPVYKRRSKYDVKGNHWWEGKR